MPFAVRPPFARTAVAERVLIIHPHSVYCCSREQWFTQTRQTIDAWSRQPDRPPAISLVWYASDGGLVRRSETDVPQLRSEILRLTTVETPDNLERRLEALLHQFGS